MRTRSRLPKRRYVLIHRARSTVSVLLERLGLRPLNPRFTPQVAARGQARFYMTPVRTRGSRVVWFKASLEKSPALDRGLRSEINVQRTFADYEKRFRPRFDTPSFIAAGRDRGILWNVRRYWVGPFAGIMDRDFGYTSRFLRLIGPRHMANVLSDVRQMTRSLRSRLPLVHHRLPWYLFDLRHYERYFFTPLLHHRLNPGWKRRDVQRMERSLKQHAPFLRRHATVFTHGDLYPNNVILSGKERDRVVLFDWELAHLNLPTFDPVMVHLLAWRDPAWQRAFRRQTETLLGKDATTATAWRLATLSLATRLAGYCFLRLTGREPERYPPLSRKDRPTLTRLYWLMIEQLMDAIT